MRTVVDGDDRRWVLLKQSSESSRVRDPETGEETFRPNDDLEPAGGESPFEALARAVPGPARRILRACHEDWQVGLLVSLADDGPRPVRALLGESAACESDFLGAVTELRAAGLLAETTVAGERAYELTDAGRDGVDALRQTD
ncbi:DUF7346 family protein [Halobacterium jilantaiense]|uniref:HTH hxlR-type domain-containing protein n=1 Tax=Halobacterium jilantaiense TaxID=355548 RepID=A0A1I0NNJ1_9EURY|nr:hypothetical protein [Halobacterium jilantaiense]SEW02898.1 hypothetical protein SAMN04487945_1018 [Halobacterium jilantaiense]